MKLAASIGTTLAGSKQFSREVGFRLQCPVATPKILVPGQSNSSNTVQVAADLGPI